ncbi:MAG TPA: PIN domain-containing protein [Balneolaceae bacterium]|nr:PIN domain-containing protein [Balneolaceae bacterium]
MIIYLDTCCIQRPLDDKSQLRIRLESEAILGIFDYFESGKVQIVSSDVLCFETERNPNEIRKQFAVEVLSEANNHLLLTDKIEKKAKLYEKEGVKSLDALHLATAVEAKVDYFCTCDDELLKKAKKAETGKITVISPTKLISEIEK